MDFGNVKKISIEAGDVKQIEVNGVVIWKSGYTNLVPKSIDIDGSIYQGKGYIDGYRLSSNGSLSSQLNTVTTGYIRCKSTDIIRMAGATWKHNNGYTYLSFFDSSFVLLGSINQGSTGDSTARGSVSGETSITIENGITTFRPVFDSNAASVAYFRLSGQGSGADMIVTVNEAID